MEAVILILVLLFVAFVVAGAYVTVKAVGAARRSVDRTVTQARRTVEDTALRAKSFGQPGVQGELAQLRLRLRTSMRATQEALQAGVPEDASLSESIGLFQRLSVHGHELDAELKQLERDPDRKRIAERLQELRDRTDSITHSADSLRWAARDRARRFADDDLSTLTSQIDVESGALRHWTVAEPPQGSTGPYGSDAAYGSNVPQGSTVPQDENPTVVDQTWPEPPPAEGPQAIGPTDATRGAGYPWQRPAREKEPRKQSLRKQPRQKSPRSAKPETGN